MTKHTVGLKFDTDLDQASRRPTLHTAGSVLVLCLAAVLTFSMGLGFGADAVAQVVDGTGGDAAAPAPADYGTAPPDSGVVEVMPPDSSGVVSDYAAVNASLPATIAAGRTPGAFGVTSTGATSYSIPLWTPPGVGSVDLKLSLTYNSRGPDGTTGQGWALAGLSTIRRCNKTLAQDGVYAPVLYTAADRYCLDGQQLKLASGTYGAAGSVYATEIESFSKIAKTASGSFIVTTKNGLVYEYGTSSNSIIVDGATGVPRLWALSKIHDRLSPIPNQISLTYTNDAAVAGSGNLGTFRIASITYPTTASGQGPFYQVDFSYTARPATDPIVGYLAGSFIRESNKLDTITIHPYGSGITTKSYNLAYTQGSATSRLLLSSVTECAANSCMRPTTITYNAGSTGWPTGLNTGLSATGYLGPVPADLNGDGRADLFYSVLSGSTNSHWWAAMATATGYATAIDTGITTSNSSEVLTGRFSGQGKDQLLVMQAGYWNVVTYTGTTFTNVSTGVAATFNQVGQSGASDWDGDGLTDLIIATDATVKVYRNVTAPPGAVAFATTPLTVYSNPAGVVSVGTNAAYSQVDFNGDGRADILMVWHSDPYSLDFVWHALMSNGFGAAASDVTLTTTPYGQMADYNGDGCTDFYSETSGGLMSNCAGGFTAVPPAALPANFTFPTAHMVVDENGDGRADYLFVNDGDHKWYVIRSKGDSFAAAVYANVLAPAGTAWFPLDQNGDGLTDLGYRDDRSGASHKISFLLHNTTASPADVATLFTDGYGVTQGAAYVSIVQSNYTKGTGAVFPEVDVQSPLFVVSQANINGNTSGAFQQQFIYTGARTHLQGRGFEGFASMRTYDSRTGFYSFNYSNQTFPYTGVSAQRTVLQNNLTTKVTDSVSTYQVQAVGSAGYEQRKFPYAQSVTDSQYEYAGTLNGTLISQAVTNYTYGDTFGNPTLISRTITDKDPGSPYFATQWTASVGASYANNTSTNCMGLPQSVTETRTAPGKPQMARTISYTADTTNCRITGQVLEPNAPEQKVTTTLEFDTCGNTSAFHILGANWNGAALAERVTRIDYGTRCQLPESITNPLNEVRRMAYRYDLGVPSSVTDGNGLVTSWIYDDFIHRLSESRPDGTSTAWTYDSCATQNCISTSGPYQRYHEHEVSTGTGGQSDVSDQRDRYYDGRGTLELQKYTMPLGVVVSDKYAYDAFNRVVTEYNPAATIANGYTIYAYDAVGRVQSVKLYNSGGSLDRTTTIAYAGRTTSVTDPLIHTRSTITDVAGNIRQVTDPSPGGTTIYDYDSIGNRTSILDAGGASSSGTYNQRGFRLTWTDADSGRWEFDTDSLGELVGWRDAKGQPFSAIYDLLGRMTSRTELGVQSTWTWGNSAANFNIGRLWKKDGYGYAEELSYNGSGKLSARKITTDQVYQYDYSYNSIGEVDTVSYPTSPVPAQQTGTRFKAKYYYNYGVPVSITDASDAAEKTLWALTAANAYGSATSESLGGVATVTSGYKTWTNELTSSQVGKTTTTDRQNLTYQWDTVGNLTQRQDVNQSITEVFSLDSLDRVTGSTRNGAPNLTVTYNAAGNISSKSDVSAASYAYTDMAHPHAVTTAGTRTFTYDANGNQKTRDGVTQTWASFNLPTTLAQPIGGTTYTTQFSYGPDHQRWKQIANYSNGVETTQYLGGLLEKESTTSTNVTYWRHYVSTPSGMVVVSRNSDLTGTTKFVVTDHLGSSDLTLDSTGNTAARLSFTAFGARRGSDWTTTTPPDWLGIANSTRHGYTGHEHLDNVNLIHMGGRVFDPVVGRFMSVDPLITDISDSQSVNPYAYIGNRPLNATDPSGYGTNPMRMSFLLGSKGFGFNISFGGASGGEAAGAGAQGSAVGGAFFWVGMVMFFMDMMENARPVPPAYSLPGITAESGVGLCGVGTFSAICGGTMSFSGSQAEAGDSPTSPITSIVVDIFISVIPGVNTVVGVYDAYIVFHDPSASDFDRAIAVISVLPGGRIVKEGRAIIKILEEGARVERRVEEAADVVKVGKAAVPYKRPPGATTASQRASVQGKPCVKCGATTPRQVAGHKEALVKEHYETGSIDQERMRSTDAVQPECPTCSAREGAEMSRYSREKRQELEK